jgi:hypothetical protein
MDRDLRANCLGIANQRAAEGQNVTEVLTLAAALSRWVETGRFPEEAESPNRSNRCTEDCSS